MRGLLTGTGEARAPGAATSSGRPDEGRPPSDAQLVAASIAGDVESWDTLVSRYGRLVYSVGIREGLDGEGAADVVEAAFLALLDAGESLQDCDRPAAWLVSAARQEVVRVQRGRAHHQDFAGRRSSTTEPSAAAHGVELGVSCEWDRVSTLHQVLAQLPPQLRELIDRDYLDHARPLVGTPRHRSVDDVDAHDHERSRALDRLRLALAEENEL